MARLRRAGRGALAGLFTGLALVGALGASHFRGIAWSNGSGTLWGIANGSWVTITMTPGPSPPGPGPRLVSSRAPGIRVSGSNSAPMSVRSLSLNAGLAVPAALIAGISAWALWRDRTRRAWECARCGYDLRGLRESAPCPECGAAAP